VDLQQVIDVDLGNPAILYWSRVLQPASKSQLDPFLRRDPQIYFAKVPAHPESGIGENTFVEDLRQSPAIPGSCPPLIRSVLE